MEIKRLDNQSEAKSLANERTAATYPAHPPTEIGPANFIPNSAQVFLSDAAQELLDTERTAALSTEKQPVNLNRAADDASPRINAIAESLLGYLSQEIEVLERLKETLKEETTLLGMTTRVLNTQPVDFDKLEALSDTLQVASEAKTSAGARLTELSKERDALLVWAGLPKGDDGISRIVGNVPLLAQTWAKVQQISQEAREINRQNGMVEQLHINHAQQALEELKNSSDEGGGYI